MADKNKNGIPDDQEIFRPGQKVKPMANSFTGQSRVRAGVNPFFKDLETSGNPFGILVNPVRQGLNWFGDIGNWGNDTRADRVGTGLGDSILGVQSGYYDNVNRTARRANKQAGAKFQKASGGIPGTSPISFADALAQAMSLIQGGGGGIPSVNYDPERNAARQNASEADARLAAMYNQLRQSIDADTPVIQAAYQQAVDSTNKNAQQAQMNAQQAVDASQARNQSVLANLGIGDANQQIIAQGRDANTAAAQQIADMAAAQQAAATNLTQNQEASVQQNRGISSAAGLEGNLQRARNQARLQELLARIDSAEMDQNSQIAAQNAQLGQSRLSSALSLASQLYGANRDDIDRENALQLQAAKMSQPTGIQQGLGILNQILNDNGGLFGSDEALNADQLIKLLLGLSK